MSTSTSWIILSLGVQLVAPILNRKGYQRGKLFTMPLRRHVRWFDNQFCRLMQLFFVVYPLNLITGLFLSSTPNSILFSIAVIALYLDDYFTNHDDYKKFGDWVRNKIKWKMELPVQQPVKVRS